MTNFRLVGGTDVQPPASIEMPRVPTRADEKPTLASTETLSTTTARNGKLREKRKEIWRAAEAATRYWRVRLDFNDAVEQAQRMEIPEGRYHPIGDRDERLPMVKRWREAMARQLLTPAPDVGSVTWKKMVLAGRQLRYTDMKPERVERAIADDLAFLAAHPVRQSNRRR
jgi:hypothetical protein